MLTKIYNLWLTTDNLIRNAQRKTLFCGYCKDSAKPCIAKILQNPVPCLSLAVQALTTKILPTKCLNIAEPQIFCPLKITRYTVLIYLYRLGFDKHLGVNFDPTSTDVRYVDLFKKCGQKFQESNNLIGRCQLGVLCSDTVNKLRHVLRTDKNFTR